MPARERIRPAVPAGEAIDGEWSRRWEQRDRLWQAYRSAPLMVSPSDFIHQPSPRSLRKAKAGEHQIFGKVFGTMVHRLLQHWDFSGDVAAQLAAITATSLAWEGEDREQQSILDEIRTLLQTFAESAPYARLCQATVIGREVPFLLPWNDGRQILEGVVDVLYRLDGKLWIADYKTDMIPADQAPARAEVYREQARLYQDAVARSLGEPVAGFEFIFLRPGVAVTG